MAREAETPKDRESKAKESRAEGPREDLEPNDSRAEKARGVLTIDDLHQIEARVRFFLKGLKSLDVEEISVGIWTELWTHKKPLTWTIVKSRCIDAIRKHQRLKEVSFDQNPEVFREVVRLSEREAFDEINTRLDRIQLLDCLMKCPSLSKSDKQYIYLRFYQGLTGEQIGRRYGVSLRMANRLVQNAIIKIQKWILEISQKGT